MLAPNDLTLNYVNNRINQEICYNTISKLADNNLLTEYKNCHSVQNEIKKLTKIFEKYKIDPDIKESILDDYLLELIPAGTKGVIRGNKFNSIVKSTINNINLDKTRFEIAFEKDCYLIPTSEIPDWYIIDKKTKKLIIGMNQLDFWGGGHQINRGFKYLVDNKINTDNSKLLCIICNHKVFKTKKQKSFKLFECGFNNDTVCYLKNLENIIRNYFNYFK